MASSIEMTHGYETSADGQELQDQDHNESTDIQIGNTSWCSRKTIVLAIVLFISLLAIILVILNIVGVIGKECSCKLDEGMSNQQLYELQKQETARTLQLYINNTNDMSRKGDVNLEKKLQKNINNAIDMSNAGDKNLMSRLQNLENKEKLDVILLQKNINDTIDTCNAGDATLTTRLQAQETKEQTDVTQLQKNINDTIDKCNAGDATLTTRLQAQETKEQTDVTLLQKNINDTNDKCNAGDATLTTRLQAQETKEQTDVTLLQNNINDTIDKCMAVNSSLVQMIRGSSIGQGKKEPPDSMCEFKVETNKTHKQENISLSVSKLQPEGYVIWNPTCSTSGTLPPNRYPEINIPQNGGNPTFVCTCKGQSKHFSSYGSYVSCSLHYKLCPKTT